MEYEPGVPDGDPWPQPAASPHLSPDPAPAAQARRGVPRVALVAAGALVVAGALWYALSPGTTVVVAERPERGRALAPLQTSADPRTGEETAPFSGFAVAVETLPSGALVVIDGVERGEAPVLAGIECSPGDRVEIAARKRGLGPVRAATTCREDTLVKLTLRLTR